MNKFKVEDILLALEKIAKMTGEDENYWVVCKKCLAEGPTSNLSSVIYVWNKRK